MTARTPKVHRVAHIEAGGLKVTVTFGMPPDLPDSKSPSPRARARQSMRARYRARGRNNSNLWLVYSPKTDSDWILGSDYELVHWLAHLEAEPEVRTFDLAPEVVFAYDHRELRGTELDAEVTRRDGQEIWREIKGIESNSEAEISQRVAQEAAAASEGKRYERLTHDQLSQVATLATRWMKPIAYAAALRDRNHQVCYDAVARTCGDLREGTVGMVLARNPDLIRDDLIGELVRYGAHGKIILDLSKRTFGLLTPWRCYER